MYVVAAISIMLAVIGWIAQWWQRLSMTGIHYRRKFYFQRGFPGEQIDVKIEAENQKFLPIPWLKVSDPWSLAVGPETDVLIPTEHSDKGLLVSLYSLRWYERIRRTYTILLRKRGVYPIGPAFLETGDLFGIFSREKEETSRDYITVFPEIVPFSMLNLPSEDPFGDRRATRKLFEDPAQPTSIRDYHVEDDFRRIHWPATAHTGNLMVKTYQQISSRVMIVCLNAATMPHYWEGAYPEMLEHLVKVAASIVEKGLENGYRVGILSNGSLAHADQPFRVPPGRSPGQLARLLEALAGVTPFITMAFEKFLDTEMSRLPYGATMVIISGWYTPLLGEILFKLRKHGHRITLLLFSQKAPEKIPGIQLVHIPFEY